MLFAVSGIGENSYQAMIVLYSLNFCTDYQQLGGRKAHCSDFLKKTLTPLPINKIRAGRARKEVKDPTLTKMTASLYQFRLLELIRITGSL